MEYAKPSFDRMDLMVEHCMCCTGLERILEDCNGTSPLFMPLQS